MVKKLLLGIGSLLCIANLAMAQNAMDLEFDMATRKAMGAIPQPEQARWQGPYPDVSGATSGNRGGGCWIPVDGTFTTATVSANDDGFTSVIPLPFNFCLYGTNYTTMYINVNGNITFNAGFGTFTSTGFPTATPMVAPFWADANLNVGGTIYYKVSATNAIVIWDAVGDYGGNGSLSNTFQLVITNGADPILSATNNVRFAYQDMQWTTGTASQGSGGFGGTAATVGVNSGDGTTFVQIGRFDANSSTYDGPGGNNDGVNYLDNLCFEFDVCNTTNQPPSVVGFTTTTYDLCVGQTANITGTAIGPESGQTVTFTFNNGGLATVASNTNTPGNPATLDLTVTATAADVGSHTLVITATDNGTPVEASTVSITINVTAGPTPTVSGPTSACVGGLVTLSASAGTSYSWSPSGGSGQTASVGPGAYTVTVTDASGCSGASVPYIVNQDAAPTPFIVGPTTVCPGSTVTLTADAGFSTYAWSPSGGSAQTADVAAGTYIVAVTSASGCTGQSAPFTITSSNNIVPVIVGDNSLCPGQTTTLDAGAGYDSYVWSPGGETTQTINNIGLGNYSVSVVDGVCSGISTTYAVAAAPALSPVITGTSAVCTGLTTTLDAGAGFASYSWTPNSQTTQTVSASIGSYTVTVIDADGCTGTSPQFAVSQAPDPTPNITGSLNYCSGAGATLDGGSGFVTYTWNPGGAAGQTATLPAGTYTVTVVDGLGCTGTSLPVTVSNTPPAAPIITGPAGVCGTAFITLDAGAGYQTYSWSPGGQTLQTASVGAGTYTVTVSNGPGCSATSAPFTVTTGVAPAPIITGPTAYCVSVTSGVTISADPTYITYLWSPGGMTTPDVFVPGGNYTLNVTDAAGCVGTATFTVTQVSNAPTPIITPDGPTTFCQGEDVILSGPVGFETYVWSTGSFTPDITAFETGTYILYVIDSLGCQSAINSIDITADQLVVAAFSPGLNQFDADFLNLSINANTYQWSFGDGGTDININPTHTYTGPGVYTVMLVASNNCGNDTAYFTIDLGDIGIDDQLANAGQISVWPNPAESELIIAIDGSHGDQIVFEIIDASGRLIMQESAAVQPDGIKLRLDVAHLVNGLYTIVATGSVHRSATKVNVMH